MEDDYEPAVDAFMHILTHDRPFRDDAGRKALLGLFSLLDESDERVAGWLDSAGLTRIQCRADANVFNRIRLVKTDAELTLMRRAASINEAAAREAAAAFCEGAEWHEIESVYAASMAAAHVTGAGALLLARKGSASPQEVREALVSASRPHVLYAPTSTTNQLVWVADLLQHDDAGGNQGGRHGKLQHHKCASDNGTAESGPRPTAEGHGR